MTPELRLLRYFVAVAETGNVTRAAAQLHISQPSLSAAIQQLEGQLGVELLARHGRRFSITPAGVLLRDRARELLAQADALVDDIQAHATATAGRLRLGASPTARYGLTPRLLAASAEQAPAVMLYTSEATTGELLRGVAQGDLDLALTFCSPSPPAGVELLSLGAEPAIAHLPASHRLADRPSLTVADLANETILIAASRDSGGYSARVLSAFAAAGLEPRTRPDPYPDLGLQAVREGLGVVIYTRTAFPPHLDGSAFIPLVDPQLFLPFDLAVRSNATSTAVNAILAVARGLERDAGHPTHR